MKPARKYKDIEKKAHKLSVPSSFRLECEVINGGKEFAYHELIAKFRHSVRILPDDDPETIFCEYAGDFRQWLQLRTVVAVYLLHKFEVPRPKGLLGHQNFQMILQQINKVRALHPPGAFRTFKISAAGENSSVLSRIKEEISASTQLEFDATGGDLFLRIRPSRFKEGWDVLTRISPRPLTTRSWRVYNMLGALNATIAAAMIELTQPKSADRFLNIMCGSGTLLIERLLRSKAQIAVGCDIDSDALEGAQKNLSASKLDKIVQLFEMDATRLQFPDSSFNVISSDLPWGQMVGTHESNKELYPRMLVEAARVAEPKARFVLLTHEIKLFENTLEQYATLWQLKKLVKVEQGGLHPRIYLLQRSSG